MLLLLNMHRSFRLLAFIYLFPGEGNGCPFQCSWQESSMDRGAWWATVYGVAQNRTQLKRPLTLSRTSVWLCLDCNDSIVRLSCNLELYVLSFWYSFSKLFWLFWVLCSSISVEILLEFWCRLHQVYKSSGRLFHLKNIEFYSSLV